MLYVVFKTLVLGKDWLKSCKYQGPKTSGAVIKVLAFEFDKYNIYIHIQIYIYLSIYLNTAPLYWIFSSKCPEPSGEITPKAHTSEAAQALPRNISLETTAHHDTL